MNKRYVVIAGLILLLGLLFVYVSKNLFTAKKTHYHAGFVVFQNNKKLDFSDNKYMYIEPCTRNKKGNDSQAAIQIEKAHLHDNIGNLVHIERMGAIWKNLFTNINYPIDYSKATGYINGKQVVNFQSQPIHPFDSLVVFIGDNNPDLLSQAVTKDYMITMAKKSTTCGD